MNDHRSRLAPNQEAMLFAHQSAPKDFSYNVPVHFILPQPIDTSSVQARLDRIAELRPPFMRRLSGGPYGVRFEESKRVEVELIDRNFGSRDLAAAASVEALCQETFDLFDGPLLRVYLIRYADNVNALLVIAHHIATDERSLHLLVDALISAQPPMLQHYDHDAWAQAWWDRVGASRDDLDRAAAALSGGGDASIAWGCGKAGQNQRSQRVSASLSSSTWRVISETLCKHTDVTPHSVMMAVAARCAARRSKSAKQIVATVVSQRGTAYENSLGYFSNTVPVAIDALGKTGTTISSYLASVHEVCKASYRRSHLPLVDLMADGGLFSKIPLCLVPRERRICNYIDIEGKHATAMEAPLPDFGMNQFPLTIYWTRNARGDLEIDLYYSAEYFAASVARSFVDEIAITLQIISERPNARLCEIHAVEPSECDRLFKMSCGPELPKTAETLVSRISSIVSRHPRNQALKGEDRDFSYEELWSAADRVAAELRSRGVGRGDVVAIYLERSATAIVALLGVLKLGAIYLPIDGHTPAARRTFMLEDGGARAVIASGRAEGWTAGLEIIDPEVAFASDHRGSYGDREDVNEVPSAEDTAYIIYTSGSTGTPKGVPIAHRNVVSLLDATSRLISVSNADVWTCFHSIAFDFSVWEIFGCLTTGGQLVVVPRSVALSPDDFHALLAAENVTVLNQTPTAFSQLMASDADTDLALRLRYLIFGGEALDTAILRPWFARYDTKCTAIVNMYGITETTVHCTHLSVTEQNLDEVGRSVGKPLAGWSLYVLDEMRRMTPIGVEGEIYVAGAGVAERYVNRPKLTRERFLDNPYTETGSEILYRTGDRGRYLPNGELEHLGRLDTQVKLRGFRIELLEIRAQLLRQEGVIAAAVVLDEADGDRARACVRAFVVANDSFDPKTAKQALRAALPEYMIPASISVVEKLPLTTNGKVDVGALMRTANAQPQQAHHEALSSDTLSAVINAWEKVLGTSPKETDNFFDLGGNSMLAARLKASLESEMFKNVSLRSILTHPTPRSMAAFLQTESMGR